MFAGGGGGLAGFAPKDNAADKAKSKAVAKVCSWLEQLLPDEQRADWLPGGKAPDGQETSVIVNQLACSEDGCPDVELVISLLRPKPQPKLMFKIYKAAVDLSHEELEAALVKATAEQAGKPAEGAGIPAEGASKLAEDEAGGAHASSAHGEDCGCPVDAHASSALPPAPWPTH